MDPSGALFSLAITFVALAITGVVFWRVFLPMIKYSSNVLDGLQRGVQEQQQLIASGEAGQARVLALQGTGVLVNHQPQIRMQLQVFPSSGRPPFQAECTTIISQLAIPQVQPGATLQVRFDPTNPARVAVLM